MLRGYARRSRALPKHVDIMGIAQGRADANDYASADVAIGSQGIQAMARGAAMKLITWDRLRQVFSYNESNGLFTRLIATSNRVKIGDVSNFIGKNGYVQIDLDGRTYYGHRLAWLYCYQAWPKSHLDHIDGNRNNNAIINLRECTMSENLQNQRKAHSVNSSGFLGVSWDSASRKWRAQISLLGKNRDVGRFETPEAEYVAYITAKAELHPFSQLTIK
jgi:hypothetical protein